MDGRDGADSYQVNLGSWTGTVAISDTGTIGTDTLGVSGTAGDDVINVKNGTVTWGNPVAETVTYAGVERTTVAGGSGNDAITDPDSGELTLLGEAGDDTLTIADTTGPVTADGGDGSDTYVVYGGTLQGPVTITDTGTTGTNSVTVVGTAGADTITQASSQITVNGGAPITLGAGVTSLTVDGSGGGDTFATTGTPAITPTVQGVDAAVVSGTAGNDQIHIRQGGQAGQVTVWVNGALVGTYSPTGRLVVRGLAGDDDIQADGNVAVSLWLYGGDGNDRLKGGSGNNILLGGDGDDLLVGGSNRDILIGGKGADRLVGNADDDILIAGWTLFDADEAALAALLGVWADPNRGYWERVGVIKDTGVGPGNAVKLSAATVSDEGAADVLTGTSGQDWFFANLSGDGTRDKATDLSATEFATDLDFILGP
jgi:Ca2+-binding RTX toxin-like protein